jgi:hypothetical protein
MPESVTCFVRIPRAAPHATLLSGGWTSLVRPPGITLVRCWPSRLHCRLRIDGARGTGASRATAPKLDVSNRKELRYDIPHTRYALYAGGVCARPHDEVALQR